jgi:hypothetical protein
VHTGFWWGDLNEREHSEDLGVDGRTILKWILKNRIGSELVLAQDRVKWWALVNTVMNFRVP